jgi:hypothetical protein
LPIQAIQQPNSLIQANPSSLTSLNNQVSSIKSLDVHAAMQLVIQKHTFYGQLTIRLTSGKPSVNQVGKFMRKFAFICVPLLLLAGQSAFAHGWQAAAMWDWAINTANPRFAAQQAEIDSLQAQVDAMDSNNVALQAQVDAMDAYVQQLQAYVEVDELTNPSQPVVRIVAANLQIVNGDGTTESINGTGNLIVGYNEAWGTTLACTDGYYNQDQTTCEDEGHVWAANHRSGSHNLIVGTGHSYGRFGGLVAGQYSVINGEYASVSGGSGHTASALWSSVSGGDNNIASENNTSVSGGSDNTASSYAASISGGKENTASGGYSSISGGQQNTASANYSSVSGGGMNFASGDWSSVSGGVQDTALGEFSSVSGGLRNTASGDGSSVSGGADGSAAGESDWVAGTLFEDN